MANDMIIIGFILALIIGGGTVLELAYQSIGSVYDGDIGDINDVLKDDEEISQGFFGNAWEFLSSTFDVLSWNIGTVPTWVSFIWGILLTILTITIARNIWIGGGS